MITAYKFLGERATGVFSGFRWPTPRAGEPGDWVEVEGELELGAKGVHACGPEELVNWIDDELWLVELADSIEEQDGLLVGRRGRLRERVEAWNAGTARAFAAECVRHVRDVAVHALERAGDHEAARTLGEIGELAGLEAAAAARRAAAAEPEALAYLADAVELARGGRPERYGARPGGTTPTPGAIAANLGFVAAHAVGSAAAEEASAASSYDAAFAAERERQRAWLRARLGLVE